MERKSPHGHQTLAGRTVQGFRESGNSYHEDLVLAIMIPAWAGEHVPMGRLEVHFGPA
jgi:hypothetical protein